VHCYTVKEAINPCRSCVQKLLHDKEVRELTESPDIRFPIQRFNPPISLCRTVCAMLQSNAVHTPQ
jgi:hypothetical protein